MEPGIMTTLDCIPCFVRQALETARLSTGDPEFHERIVRETLLLIANMDMRKVSPVISQQLHRHLRKLTGVDDPYLAAKDRFNRMALDMLPELEARVAKAPDPFGVATRLAIAGNVIDLGAKADLKEDDARTAVAGSMDEPFHGDLDAFRKAVDSSERILYLADNAGEIVFDRLLIEQLFPRPVVFAVRGAPVINDATVNDVRQAGLQDIVEVIDNGSDAPGTVLADCSEEFRRCFHDADLIISKGQGNFETLVGEVAPIFFLFKVKCPVVSLHTGLPVGTHVLKRFDPAHKNLIEEK